MNRLQFRVWDKERKVMMYDGFLLRHGNQISEETWNKITNGKQGELYPYKNKQQGNVGAVFTEVPDSIEKMDRICEVMGDKHACYELVDFSNFYELENTITMQSTGFHDKNGTTIFEQDILSKDGIEDEIYWYYGCYVWNGCPIAEYDSCFQGERIGANSKDFEIVGNIFEGKQC